MVSLRISRISSPPLGLGPRIYDFNSNGFFPRFPDQRLTRAQALKGMTLDAAYASHAEDRLGSLEPGKKADFVVLDRNIMTVPFSEILGVKVSATVIDGKVVYGGI